MACNLDRPTKVLIGGIFTGALVYCVGTLNTHRLERKVGELQKACVAENEAQEKSEGPLSALAGIFIGKLTCDPVELARSNGYAGIQGQLAAAQREVLRWDNWSPIAAIAMAAVSCFPWLWYFLLRRIRELREAMIGR